MSFEVKGFTVELKPTSKRWHLVLFRSDRTPDADATEIFSTRCLVTAEVTDKNINDWSIKTQINQQKNPPN